MGTYFVPVYGTLPFIDWTTPMIILFPLIVPTPPIKALLASLLAASAPGVTAAVLSSRGVIDLSSAASDHPLLAVWISPLLAVVIAGFASRWVYGLGRDVARAQELGSYRLESLIGHGGMGEVWRAQHRLLARPAAIKLIRKHVLESSRAEAAEHMMRRFEREAQATASMRSPHTIQVYDFGLTAEGEFYYVMELLEGLECSQLVSQFGPLPADRAVHFLRQVCHSLAEAHDAGLIHRDIKPSNIFACIYGRELDFLKVLDFGIVKSEREAAGAEKLTADQGTAGTPAVMSPEQILGNKPVTPASDLYAIGCLGYWLLTGRFPFEGENAMAILIQHTQERAPSPSLFCEQDVPADLDRIILSCLEKDPALRPQSAEALDKELARCQVGNEWTQEMARQWWDLHQPETPRAGSENLNL